MPRKIFISYRRQDSGANALSIGQYLEHELGRKNVFIDVDMRAGSKFPAVLEQRLAECKVMLVLIGPEWLNARDQQGCRRLENPDDWVRLEIAHALTRNITVIPVQVNGATLPLRGTLPDDIRGLLDHQAASVTIAGFRNEMLGLVRDIRAIPSPRPWRLLAGLAAGLALVLSLFQFVQKAGIERIRSLFLPQTVEVTAQQNNWHNPADWVLYEIGNQRFAHYFKLSSLGISGNRVAFTTRTALETRPAEDAFQSQETYEETLQVVDCKNLDLAMAERTVYNIQGEIVTHFKWGDPSTLDLSIGGPIKAGTVIATAAHILCDEQLRTPLVPPDQVAKLDFSFLADASNGDGRFFYGPKTTRTNSEYGFESLLVLRLYQDHKAAEIFPQFANVINLPLGGYRTTVQRVHVNCTDRKFQIPKIEYFDRENNLIYISAPSTIQPLTPNQGSPLDLLFGVVCGAPIPKVGGTYEGTNTVSYENGTGGESKISIIVEQVERDLNVNFQTALGGQGKGARKLTGTKAESISLQSTTPDCLGSYEASFEFAGETLSWSYKGRDCMGSAEGHGTARKAQL